MSLFSIWTKLFVENPFNRLPVNSYSGVLAVPSVSRPHGMTTSAKTILPSSGESEADIAATKQRIHDVEARYRDGGFELGIGVIKKNKLKDVKWERLRNAVAYVFPRSNLKFCGDIVNDIVCEDDLAVHVYPLSLVAATARLPLNDGHYIGDFRKLYLYGCLRRYNSYGDNDDICKQPEKFAKQRLSSVKQFYPRMQIVVHKGEVLKHSDICMKSCPNDLEWGMGQCSLLGSNCVLGTKLRPDMLEWSSPRLEALFGKSAFKHTKHAIAHVNFTPYFADNIIANCDQQKLIDDYRSGIAQKSGNNRRLNRLMCTSCWLAGNNIGKSYYRNDRYAKLRIACGLRPDKCRGPFFKSDLPKQLMTVAPWKYHVLCMRANTKSYDSAYKAECKTFRNRVPALYRRRAPLRVSHPIVDPEKYRSDTIWQTYSRYTTPSAKNRRSKKLVSIGMDINNDDGFRIIATYSEWCKACNVSQVHTWKQLCKQFPAMQNTTDHVHLACAKLLRGTNSWHWFSNNFYLSSDGVGYYEDSRGFHSRPWIDLSHESTLAASVFRKYLSEEREKENKEIKELIVDKSLNFVSVPDYLIKKAKLGDKKARLALRKRKPNISLPVLNLPLFDAAGVSPV